MFQLPYSFLPTPALRRASTFLIGTAEKTMTFFPSLNLSLKQARIEFSDREYLSMCYMASGMFFLFIMIFVLIISSARGMEFFLFGLLIAIVITMFIFIQQIAFPRLFAHRRVKDLEKNIMAALQNLMIQLNSGVPLFNILVNISKGSYGELSKEFSVIVKEINAGKPEVEALEDAAALNPSFFFRRTIWQIVNGMKSGANMSVVVNETINLMSEEQVLQIQRYGGQLNSLSMFYMLMVVIAPSLGMTFLTIIASFIALTDIITKMLFWGVFAAVVFFQIMFMGTIKSRRPNLLGD